MERRNFVNITGDEHVWTVQTGDRTLELQIRANPWNVDRVSIVRRVSQVLRKRVRELRRDTSRGPQSERTQQTVLTGSCARLAIDDRTETTKRSGAIRTVRRIVTRAQSGVATRDSNRSGDDFSRRWSVDIDRPNQVIASRPRIRDLTSPFRKTSC